MFIDPLWLLWYAIGLISYFIIRAYVDREILVADLVSCWFVGLFGVFLTLILLWMVIGNHMDKVLIRFKK